MLANWRPLLKIVRANLHNASVYSTSEFFFLLLLLEFVSCHGFSSGKNSKDICLCINIRTCCHLFTGKNNNEQQG